MAANVQVPTSFFGKYKLTTSENFDNFLKEIGTFPLLLFYYIIISTMNHFPILFKLFSLFLTFK